MQHDIILGSSKHRKVNNICLEMNTLVHENIWNHGYFCVEGKEMQSRRARCRDSVFLVMSSVSI